MYDKNVKGEVIMSNLFQIGADLDACGGLLPIVKVLKRGVMPLVQIGIPILLIIFGTVDLGKAVISSDEKEVKAAQGRLIKRFIYAAAIFFVTTLVVVVMNVVSKGGEGDTSSWQNCWENAYIVTK